VSGTVGGSAGAVDHGPTVGLTITPPQSTIDWNGAAAPVQLQAIPVYQDQTTGPAVPNAVWNVDFGDIATVNGSGLVTATGIRAGAVKVSAQWNGYTALAEVDVKFHLTYDPNAVPPDAQTQLTGPQTPDGALPWNYPYDGTVFPRGLAAPKMMWNGNNAGEPMLVAMTTPWVDVKAFFTSPGQDFTLPQDLWVKLTESGTGGPVSVTVSRISSGTAFQVMNHTWRFASGSLRGTVYYWANSLGRVVRIQPGAAAPDDFLAAAGVTDGCTTCHTVSANGNVLILGGGKSSDPGDSAVNVFDLVNNSVVASDRGRVWAMPALSPDGKYTVFNNAALPGPPGGYPGLFDTVSGGQVLGTNMDGTMLDMPAFAPNGSKLLFVNHDSKALAKFDYSEASGTPTMSNYLDLLPASGDQYNDAYAFPSVSPDGSWAVYHRGNLDTRLGPGDLYLASTDTPGVEIPLAGVNGTSYPFAAGDRDRHYNYEPTFAPIPAGGYFWVVFTSRRTYGNQLTGDPTVTKQIWVAAIDQQPVPGQDPSHPAFWVPGQDAATLNMRAFWALDPCKSDGAGCDNASQCCSGGCDPTSRVCGPPPGQSCKPAGGTCSAASDCCFFEQGYQCINSHCTEGKP
jgi:hypothetical protein